MNARVFTIAGHIIDRVTRVGVGGVTVEAWDRDTRFHDMLGSTVSNGDGAFWISFDPEYFGDYGGDTSPDLFFRAYRDQKLVLDTIQQTDMNLPPGLRNVVLEIDTGASTAPVEGKDRVTTQQSFKLVTFVLQSDFAGVVREQRAKANMVGSFAGRLFQSGMRNFDLEPIRPRGAQTNEIVGQPTSLAQANLAKNNVAVTDVKAYQPGANKDSLVALTSAPLRLRADDKVTLYEEEGVVRYYSVNKRQTDTNIDAAAVARIDGEVATLRTNFTELSSVRNEVADIKANFDREHAVLSEQVAGVRDQADDVAQLKSQLSELRQTAATKDVEIATLKQEVTRMRDAQADFAKHVSPEKINQLEEQLKRLSRG